MKQFKSPDIIHGFAALHFIAAVICRASGINDTLVLTMLTMLLTVIICYKGRLSLELTAIFIVLVNIFGFAAGSWISKGISMLIHDSILSHAFSTLITTEILGWGLELFIRQFPEKKPEQNNPELGTQIKWLVVAVLVIFVIRVIINSLLSARLENSQNMLEVTSSFVNNPLVLILIIVTSLLSIRYYDSHSSRFSNPAKILIFTGYFIVTAVAGALTVGFGLPFHFTAELEPDRFLVLCVVSLIANATVFSIIEMVEYALKARRNAEKEKERADLAKYQYLNLKKQVNPHFLFNSLNILDALVLDRKNEEASTYIHKLAGLYRYMLKNENEPIIPLLDEMTYVEMYTDLLKVRFQDGFRIETAIEEADFMRYIVTCSVQLLIENAIKHNAVSEAKPLVIRIFTDGKTLTVTNNLIPKIVSAQSNGLGLNYIRQLYINRCGKEIEISETADSYSVKLPLL